MTAEPLLLYLLIISGYAGKNWLLAKDNRNLIYEQIFHGIHARDLKKPVGHPSKMGIEEEEDFFSLMECLGLAAWLGGGRSGSDEDFALIRDQVYLPEREGEFHDLPSARLANVALQTFTRRTDRESPGYAFIYKSFGEYLTARALVDAGERWCGDRAPRRLNLFAQDWLQLTGGARLTLDLLRFLVDEARLRAADPQEARDRVAAFTTVASYTLRYGFPAHSALATHKAAVDWRRRETFQRNAEETLYALIHAWAEAGYLFKVSRDRKIERHWDTRPINVECDWEAGPINVEWTSPRAAADMLARLRDQWSSDHLPRLILSRWNLSGADLRMIELHKADLCGVDLSGAELCGAGLVMAYLLRADLSGADLSQAGLGGADLRWSQLSRAQLFSANLYHAHLSGADLRGADLSGANMEGVDLREADLSGACLRGAYLLRARLNGACLSGADLRETDLSGADLFKAISLERGQLDVAYGDSATRLPHGMRMPAPWLEMDC